MSTGQRDDQSMIDKLNTLTGAGLEAEGRAAAGALGGAVFARWPDGRAAVVTVFGGDVVAARRVAVAVNELAALGLPVPRHDLVVDLGDSVAFVQERLSSQTGRKLTTAKIDAICAINERFAGAAGAVAGVPPVSSWFLPDGPVTHDRVVALAQDQGRRARAVVGHLVSVAGAGRSELAGDDVVHVDLNAANVLFDEDDRATAVVDWNLGIFTGPRELALVQTRFDREWFVRARSPDPGETAAARHLDGLLAERIDADRLRTWWAFWLLHWLPKAFGLNESSVVDWHLDLAEERVG